MAVRILVIDDSAVDQELARRALPRLVAPPVPAEVVSAGDWPEATGTSSRAPSTSSSSTSTSGVSGRDVLRELGTRPHPPVIMMTGQDDVATAVETLRAGAYDYVPKSADAGPTLCRAVERVLERVRLERELAESRARLAAYAAELEQKVVARTAVVRAQAAEIEALYLKAEEASRLKNEIVANLSHELRTPLQPGRARHARRGAQPGEAAARPNPVASCPRSAEDQRRGDRALPLHARGARGGAP